MKKIYTLLLALSTFFILEVNAQFCNSSGNLIIYTNYDGGTLNINIDQNIPNIRLGIVSYEAVEVNISGPFVGNITAVEWAGYNANNGHCSPNVPTTVINGVSSSIVTENIMPASTFTDPDGYNNIICAYSCGAGNQGGCNTASQVAGYFLNSLGGSLYFQYLQYGCWGGTLNISSGGNCCDQPISNSPPNADYTYSPSNNLCLNDCVNFTDISTNTPTTWTWTFSGGNPSTSTNQNPSVCYNNPGTYSVTLVAQNAFGSDSYMSNIVINQVNTSVTQNGITLTAFTNGAIYQWLDCENGNSPVVGANSQSFTPSQSGSYSLEITENGCTDTSGCLSVNVNEIVEWKAESFLKAFPNPANDFITLEIKNKWLIGETIEVKNILGETIWNHKINSSQMNVDCSDWANGIYFIQLKNSDKVYSQKIIKQ
jgi:PKD repeat protein